MQMGDIDALRSLITIQNRHEVKARCSSFQAVFDLNILELIAATKLSKKRLVVLYIMQS